MCREQLFNTWILEIMASIVQPLGRPVHLHPSRRFEEHGAQHGPGLHLCRSMARSQCKAVSLGMARQSVYPSGNRRAKGRVVKTGASA
jgi:hypothetical protein